MNTLTQKQNIVRSRLLPGKSTKTSRRTAKSRIAAKTLSLLITILFVACFTGSQAQDNWRKRADFPDGGRYGAIGFSIGDKGYLVGPQEEAGRSRITKDYR